MINATLVILCLMLVLGALAVVAIGNLRLNSSAGIVNDGLDPGVRAPTWHAVDITGNTRTSPNRSCWQLLLFADHCLKDFPDTVAGIRALEAAQSESLEILILIRRQPDLARAVMDSLEIGSSIVPVTDQTYQQYNVRVMPFAVFVDNTGTIRNSGLVSTRGTLESMRALAKAIPDALTGYLRRG